MFGVQVQRVRFYVQPGPKIELQKYNLVNL